MARFLLNIRGALIASRVVLRTIEFSALTITHNQYAHTHERTDQNKWLVLQTALRVCCLIGFLAFVNHELWSQKVHSLKGLSLDSSAVSWFDAQIEKVHPALRTGPSPAISQPLGPSHPFHDFQNWTKATLRYQNHTFHGVPLIYDIFKNILFVWHETEQPMKVNQDQVDWFHTGSMLFWRVEGEAGFYQVLHPGKAVSLLKKSTKDETIDNRQILYIRTDKYYLQYQGKLYPADRKSRFFKLFPELKSGLKRYLKSVPRPSKPRNTDLYLSQLAQFCDKRLSQ